MYLKNDRIIVTIKGMNFRSYKAVGETGQFILDPTALTGWEDGTDSRRNATVRPVTTGDFSEPYTFSARLIAISGTVIAGSRGELQRMRDAFVGLFAEGEYSEIRVETSAAVRYATVGLENNPSFVQITDTAAAFRLELYAPDPYIYGSERIITLGATAESGGGLAYPLTYPITYNPTNILDMVSGSH
jgi:hypothetical protein